MFFIKPLILVSFKPEQHTSLNISIALNRMLFFIYELRVRKRMRRPPRVPYCQYVKVARADIRNTQYANLRNTERAQNYRTAISLSHLSYTKP